MAAGTAGALRTGIAGGGAGAARGSDDAAGPRLATSRLRLATSRPPLLDQPEKYAVYRGRVRGLHAGRSLCGAPGMLHAGSITTSDASR